MLKFFLKISAIVVALILGIAFIAAYLTGNSIIKFQSQPEKCDVECLLSSSSASCPGSFASCNCIIFSASSNCSELLSFENYEMDRSDTRLIEEVSQFASANLAPASEGKIVSEALQLFTDAYQSGNQNRFNLAQKKLARTFQNLSDSNKETLNVYTQIRGGKKLF